MIKLLYVHGLSSSGASSTVGNLKKLLSVEDTVIAPDLPIDPKKAVELLSQICQKEQPDIIVGTSMGGMFAQKLRGYPKLLINPGSGNWKSLIWTAMKGERFFTVVMKREILFHRCG